MSFLLDSNILLRMAQSTHAMHAAATQAVTTLLRQGETIHIIPQNLYEFWSVATRDIQFNGLGISIPDAQAELARLKTLCNYSGRFAASAAAECRRGFQPTERKEKAPRRVSDD